MKTFELISDEVIELVTDRIGCDRAITLDDNLTNDLGADSLDIVELIVDVERKYDVHLSDDDTAKIKTVRDIANLIFNTINQ
ncbi:MAG: acyl carrier protein [Bacteroidales bacterium]|nr:acyl carrier protein [Bacteroidales bacterium]MBR3413104.1 acyl carrier protein [Bacteroidales bacterium]